METTGIVFLRVHSFMQCNQMVIMKAEHWRFLLFYGRFEWKCFVRAKFLTC